MSKQSYLIYRNTDKKWIDKLPEHWDFIDLKRVFEIYNGSTPSSNVGEFWDGEIIWITPDDLGKNMAKYISDGTRKITEQGYKSCGTHIVPEGSIIISSRAPIGHLAISSEKLCTNQGCKSLVKRNSNTSSDFYYYLLFSLKPVLQILGKGTTFLELGSSALGKVRIPLPPFPEQLSIAAFLDRETARIDALIEKKKKLILLLKEKRTALITRAVTRGLNPDVKMKPSGIEWLGEIPEHWEVKRLKRVVELRTEKTESNEYQYLGLENIDSWSGKIINLTDFAPEGISNRFYEGDVLFGKLRPYLAKAAISSFDGICSTEIIVINSKPVYNEYLLYLILSDGFIEVVNSSTYGSKMPRASWDFIGNIKIPLPSLNEQKTIVETLKEKILTINKLTEKIEQAISKLQEYRTALISAAVTGKIRVGEPEGDTLK